MRILLKLIAGLLILLLISVTSLFLIINLVDWNEHKPFLSRMVARFTPLRIDELEGIRVSLWRTADLEWTTLKLHSESADSPLESFTSGPLAVRVSVLPLLQKRELLVQNLTMDSGRLKLRETPPQEKLVNEDEEGASDILKKLPRIFVNLISIVDSEVSYKGQVFAVEKLQLEAPKDDPTPRLRGNGVFDDLVWKMEGETGTLQNFSEEGKPFPVAVRLSLGKHRAEAKGTVMFADSTGSFEVNAKGPDLEEFKKLFRLNLGRVPPYELAFKIQVQPQLFGFEDIDLKLGQSAMRGSGQLDFRNARPSLKADINSPVTAQKDFAGVFQTDSRYKPKNEPPKPPGQYFSDKPIDMSALRKMDIGVHYVVKEFRGEKSGTAIRGWDAKVNIKKGDLHIDPVSFNVASGKIGGRFLMDHRNDQYVVKIELGAKRVDLNNLLGPIAKEIPVFDLKPTDMARGLLTGQLDLDMTGRTPMQLARSIKGPIELAVEDGKLSGTVIEAFGIDITQTISNWFNKHPLYDIQCALTAFDAKDGAIKARNILIATKDTSITGKGEANLVGNKVDFVLNAHPHDFSIGSLRSPIEIKGPLNEIEVSLAKEELLTRSGLAVALGTLVAPLAAVVPLIEPGLDKTGKCRSVVQELQAVSEKASRLSSGTPKAPAPR